MSGCNFTDNGDGTVTDNATGASNNAIFTLTNGDTGSEIYLPIVIKDN